MARQTAVIFGAGATKACKGPLTNEILPRAFDLRDDPRIAREGFLQTVEAFLVENFNLPVKHEERSIDHYPPLPLLLSLVDTAVDRKQSFSATWSTDRLISVRDSLDYLIFAVLEHDLERIGTNGDDVAIISFNYDIIADNALMGITGSFPDYGCDIATRLYREHLESKQIDGGNGGLRERPRLYKPHGSLNWMYCPACQRLDLGVTDSGRSTIKVLDQLYRELPMDKISLEHRYSCQGSPCADDKCKTSVRPVMITPTHLKDYRNPHIGRIWYGAAQALRRAERVYIVGYSMPHDDVDVIYLLKRNLSHLAPEQITVVEFDPTNPPIEKHDAGKRYRALFGNNIGWFTNGFKDYAENVLM
jgi:hypothetical protein